MSSDLGNANGAPPMYSSSDRAEFELLPSQPRPRSFSAPNSTAPPRNELFESSHSATLEESLSVSQDLATPVRRPRGWTSRLRLSPLSNVMSRLTPGSSSVATPLEDSRQALGQVPPPNILENPLKEPPPAYDTEVDQVFETTEDPRYSSDTSDADGESRVTDASIETLRADDSPIPSATSAEFPNLSPIEESPIFMPKMPRKPWKRRNTGPPASHITEPSNYIEKNITVECRILPDTANLAKPVPLDSFGES